MKQKNNLRTPVRLMGLKYLKIDKLERPPILFTNKTNRKTNDGKHSHFAASSDARLREFAVYGRKKHFYAPRCCKTFGN